MTDDTVPGESGGNLDDVTPNVQAAPHDNPSQPEEGAGEQDHQGLGTPGSDEKPNIDQSEVTKPASATDAYLATEKPPESSPHYWEFLKKRGYTLQNYIDVVAENATSKEIYDLWVTKLRKYAESYDKNHATERTPRLARSLIDYVGAVDDRLQKIESRIGITSKETKKPEHASGEDHSVQTRFYNASAQPQSRSASMDDDEPGWNMKGSFLSETDAKHCLRVLFNWVQDHTISTDSQSDDEHPDPERIEISEIRIHSDPISAFLVKQLDYEVQKDSVVRLKRPFRSLIRKVDSIKKQLSFLENEYRYVYSFFLILVWQTEKADSVDRDAGNAPESGSVKAMTDDLHSRSNPSTQPKAANKDPDGASRQPSFDREEALYDFRELVAFLDKYLGKEISLYKGYSTGKLQEIAFESLWMLFDAGELIYCPFQKRDGTLPKIYNDDNRNNMAIPLDVHTPQAYRVLATSGGISATKENRRAGRPFLEENDYDQITDSEDKSGSVAVSSKRERYTPFFIDCYFAHFDGSRFSPGQNWLEFKPFEGTVKVQSLLAYPMCYRPDDLSESLDLYERGRQFLELTVVDHRHYDGVTLGGDKEDINSPVIIDYKMGLENNKHWNPNFPWLFMASWKDEPRQILEIPTRSCSHVDCHKSACLEDAYPAHQREGCEKKMRSLTSQLDELEIPTSRSGAGLEKLKAEMAKMGLLDLLPGYGLAYVLRGRKWGKLSTDHCCV